MGYLRPVKVSEINCWSWSQDSNRDIVPGRGMWDIIVIPKLHYKWEEKAEKVEKFAILVRINHGIGDGFSFMKLVMREIAGEGAGKYVPPSSIPPIKTRLSCRE